ncbi:MAG: ester cyclase [Rhizobiales bacterium]|nr:ester cyclase [Hyphomicrobiales bacterium]
MVRPGRDRHHAWPQGFQDFHQRPFLRAVPDRKGGNHKARFAEDDYVASTGWPSLRATLTGPNWLGLPPTGARVDMRVMDWWRCEGGLLRENWVLIDLLDVQIQCGLDPFDRLAFEAGRRNRCPAPNDA